MLRLSWPVNRVQNKVGACSSETYLGRKRRSGERRMGSWSMRDPVQVEVFIHLKQWQSRTLYISSHDIFAWPTLYGLGAYMVTKCAALKCQDQV